MTFLNDQERDLWKDVVLRTIRNTAGKTTQRPESADAVVMAFRQRNTPTPTPSILLEVAAVKSVEQLAEPVKVETPDDGWLPIETVPLYTDVLVQYRTGLVQISNFMALQDFGNVILWQPLPKARVA